MEDVELYPEQISAVKQMRNGCILCGEVGTGKSRTSLAYYHKRYGGFCKPFEKMTEPHDLYIITTAKKRDSLEWLDDMLIFGLHDDPECCLYGQKIKIKIDSWNNINKYVDVKDSFFIFDEQRVVGHGAWVKSFIKISKSNEWILLSATPGDTWMDYVPVFIANGFYKNRTQFNNEHVKFNPHSPFPQVDRYFNTGRLIRLRNRILVDIPLDKHTNPIHTDIYCDFDRIIYKDVMKNRYDPVTHEPFQNANALCLALRKIVNSDETRITEVMEIVDKCQKAIIFYNYDYELELLKSCDYGKGFVIAEWNGHKHQEIPSGNKWVYLVQYNAGNEGWNCIRTDTIIFYSNNYSYKVMKQAAGRIDRTNTPFTDLYYYHLKSRSSIDLAIDKAIREKKMFNESRFAKY